ncbi:EGF-like repeat and discoidin I-like domain-containing protein 3 [Nematostella vectensis]|uniref:EGF-like repeat and discoidin I-like domain-containing protein 3 n=1 Tax=Nematostella vectensis TaxID=45351 RepID=UPI002076F76C|nr:EGF-like repeat and discoidin I-like domain-containing protein 3 [Nematostella vectensis]
MFRDGQMENFKGAWVRSQHGANEIFRLPLVINLGPHKIARKKDSADSIYKTWCELLSDDKFNASDKFNFNTSSNHYSIPNPCDQLKCANGGKCRANYGGNTGKCQCEPGFTGETCDTDAFDDCASVPCKNNGTCQDIGNSYICTCADKFAGKHCTLNCTALGMEDRRILDSQITASSSKHHVYFAPKYARLRNTFQGGVSYGCWLPRSAQAGEYLQVDLRGVKNISKVATQGQPYSKNDPGHTHWVTRYALSYSLDGVTWTTYPHEFPGNTDLESVVSHTLPVTIQARYIRFVVKAWNVNPAMRVEIYECGA